MLNDLHDYCQFGTQNFAKIEDFFKMIEIMSSDGDSVLKMILEQFHSFLFKKFNIRTDVGNFEDASNWDTVKYLEAISSQFLEFRKCVPRFVSEIKNRNLAEFSENDMSVNEYSKNRTLEAFVREFILNFLDFGLKILLKLHKPENGYEDSSNLL